MRRLLLGLALLFASIGAVAQQDYVGRFDAFTGFSYLESPKLNLAERGFNPQFGVNITRWLALGADFSVFTGHSSLTPTELAPAQQQVLAGLLGTLPPSVLATLPNPITVPYDSTTWTFAAGPQINIRKLKWITFFIHPDLGVMHESVTLKPTNAILTAAVTAIAGGTKKTDQEAFYGFGGGIDFNASRHVAIRAASDFVHVNLFPNLLNGGRNSVRMSIGPTFRFGKNLE